MSQTHLLLLVLAVILVGTVLVIGTSVFFDRFTTSNFDNLLTQATSIAGQAQHWKVTPEFFDGSPDGSKKEPANFKGLDFSSMGMKPVPGNPLCYQSSVGQFTLEVEPDGLWL